jgi:hypothetical protein
VNVLLSRHETAATRGHDRTLNEAIRRAGGGKMRANEDSMEAKTAESFSVIEESKEASIASNSEENIDNRLEVSWPNGPAASATNPERKSMGAT